MAKVIHNLLNESKTYGGMIIPANDSYIISEEELKAFQRDVKVLAGLTSDPATVAIERSEGSGQLTGLEGVDALIVSEVVVTDIAATYPFAQKKLPDGKKLKRRKHGKRMSCPGNADTDILFAVPYNHCKIDEVEVVNCSANDDIDLMVLDTATGTYTQMFSGTAVPDAVLDQFGFDVAVSDLYYSDSSNYDADLYIGMVIKVVFKNKEVDTKNIGVNFVLHEVI